MQNIDCTHLLDPKREVEKQQKEMDSRIRGPSKTRMHDAT